ncbi:hypothetical protein BC629DRAFT_808983 [Irpex lacteus]|nr:hypothetical protein BC629DRAFT_808983 [Irpex lacteus]
MILRPELQGACCMPTRDAYASRLRVEYVHLGCRCCILWVVNRLTALLVFRYLAQRLFSLMQTVLSYLSETASHQTLVPSTTRITSRRSTSPFLGYRTVDRVNDRDLHNNQAIFSSKEERTRVDPPFMLGSAAVRICSNLASVPSSAWRTQPCH